MTVSVVGVYESERTRVYVLVIFLLFHDKKLNTSNTFDVFRSNRTKVIPELSETVRPNRSSKKYLMILIKASCKAIQLLISF